MRTTDVVRTAFRNAFRSRLRTTLTVLAIVVGAFTLALTNGIGAGINSFVTSTVASVGVDDVMTVTRTTEQTTFNAGPAEYDPNQIETDSGPQGGPGPSSLAVALTSEDIETIAAVDGVVRVEPNLDVSLDYVQRAGGPRYRLALAQFVPGMQVELAAGEQVDLDASTAQIVLPDSYLGPLGFDDAADAIGQQVVLALTDATGQQVNSSAEVVGVAEPGLVSSSGAIPNDRLVETLYDLQVTGAPAGQGDRYVSASVWFDAAAGDTATDALRDRLADAGYTATTLHDQLGSITAVIDIVVLVLNGFALIALLAASMGIVNTLFMAVQERTREVGLMKAMGLSSATVFSLFSIEAVVIGLLGSVVGVLAAVGAGQIVGAALSSTVLADLPGLTLVLFEPTTVATVVLGIMAVAFLAGTLPALRAAKQDPISSLRYE